MHWIAAGLLSFASGNQLTINTIDWRSIQSIEHNSAAFVKKIVENCSVILLLVLKTVWRIEPKRQYDYHHPIPVFYFSIWKYLPFFNPNRQGKAPIVTPQAEHFHTGGSCKRKVLTCRTTKRILTIGRYTIGEISPAYNIAANKTMCSYLISACLTWPLSKFVLLFTNWIPYWYLVNSVV